jgi:hypothetical protein
MTAEKDKYVACVILWVKADITNLQYIYSTASIKIKEGFLQTTEDLSRLCLQKAACLTLATSMPDLGNL